MNDLDQRVAELLGFQIHEEFFIEGKDYVAKYGLPFVYETGPKDGIYYGDTLFTCRGRRYIRPDGFTPSSDVSQAIELLEGLQWDVGTACGGHFYCQVTKSLSRFEDPIRQSGQSPAEAICRAFISYKESSKGEKTE